MTAERLRDFQERLKERVDAGALRPSGAKAWDPPTAASFAWGTVLAFDQTLTKCGWARVEIGPGGLSVPARGVIRPQPSVDITNGLEVLYAKAELLQSELVSVMMCWGTDVDAVVHEKPMIGGRHSESSLMAGREVRIAHQYLDAPLFMLSRDSMSSRLLAPEDRRGKGKKPVRIMLDQLGVERPGTDPWSEDIQDAAALGLYRQMLVAEEARA